MNKLNFVPMDNKACGYYRVIYPAQSLYNYHRVNISPIRTFNNFGEDYVFTQRICNKEVFEQLLEYKNKNHVKFIIDYDDLLWSELPSYNKCNIDWDNNYKDMNLYLSQLADIIICSTISLERSIREFDGCNNTIVIPNMLDPNRWRFDNYNVNKDKSFFYAGSPTHWSNDELGDFTPELVKYLNNHKVNVMGTIPTFLTNANKVIGWCEINNYPTLFAKYALPNNFVISPLEDNLFNSCKSDLKYLECCAIGRVCLCNDVGEYKRIAHPYQVIPRNADYNQIDYIVNRANKHYNEILKWQYNKLDERWLDYRKYEQVMI